MTLMYFFGAQAGSVTVLAVRKLSPNASLSLFVFDTELMEVLIAGQIYAAAGNQCSAVGWSNEHLDALSMPFDKLFDKSPEATSLRKDDFDGVNSLHDWIDHQKSSSWLQERRQYWFESRDWEDLVATDKAVLASCMESFR
ncbi:MAG: hypothetical protein OXG15_03215 [Gammaproteobacteria bacterium]|nr:hypothetical protein [Gammaproteobacteria bacterium]